MSSTASSRTFNSVLIAAWLAGCAAAPPDAPADALASRDRWRIEAESPDARVTLAGGVMDIDTPAGITVWLDRELTGPVEITFDATAVAAGGPNDQVSDLNVFWMANNADGVVPVHAKRRSGRFAEYNDLLTYYVGLGGNRNTTTRFRRYIGDPQIRPLLPEHDLSSADTRLVPNRRQTITLVAAGGHIEYRRDGKTLFAYEDPAPYRRGWFALRTTHSHLRIEALRIRGLSDR